MINKCAKVVVTYFGERRRFEFYEDDTIDLMKYTIDNEENVDPGNDIELDLVIVNNSFYDSRFKKGTDYLQSFHGKKTKTGKVIILPGDNIGISFGGYNNAYQSLKTKNNYDYWMFTEDDVIFTENGYYRSMIDQINKDEECTFVAACGVSCDLSHAHGSIGLTKREYLEKVCIMNGGKLQFFEEAMDDKSFGNIDSQIVYGEIGFSNSFIKIGGKLKKTNFEKCPFKRWMLDLISLDKKMWGLNPTVSDDSKTKLGIKPKKYKFLF